MRVGLMLNEEFPTHNLDGSTNKADRTRFRARSNCSRQSFQCSADENDEFRLRIVTAETEANISNTWDGPSYRLSPKIILPPMQLNLFSHDRPDNPLARIKLSLMLKQPSLRRTPPHT